MPRWHNFVAIVALLFVAGALWPWAVTNRIVCATIAFALIIFVLSSRLRLHALNLTRSRPTIADAQARIDRIRADREKRFTRR